MKCLALQTLSSSNIYLVMYTGCVVRLGFSFALNATVFNIFLSDVYHCKYCLYLEIIKQL